MLTIRRSERQTTGDCYRDLGKGWETVRGCWEMVQECQETAQGCLDWELALERWEW